MSEPMSLLKRDGRTVPFNVKLRSIRQMPQRNQIVEQLHWN